MHKMYLLIDISADNVGDLPPFLYNFIDYIDISIGGQLIDRHYSEWFLIWHELFEDNSKSIALSNMVGVKNNNTTGKKTLTLPLRFWFNNNVGLSLPLIALQFSDVKLDIKFKSSNLISRFAYGKNAENDIGSDSNVSIFNARILTQFIHLDNEERRIFSSNNHEYLITQVQNSKNNVIPNYTNLYKSSDFESIFHKIDLRFNYPVKEIFWTIQDLKGGYDNDLYYNNASIYEYNYWNNYEYGKEQIGLCNLIVNGKELMEELHADFYRNIQQYKYHKGDGIRDIDVSSTSNNNYPDESSIKLEKGSGVYSYSFSLYPEDFQPSGSVNFSKLENVQLRFSLKENTHLPSGSADNGSETNKNVNIYALSYNVLRIMSGMAGLAFIN